MICFGRHAALLSGASPPCADDGSVDVVSPNPPVRGGTSRGQVFPEADIWGVMRQNQEASVTDTGHLERALGRGPTYPSGQYFKYSSAAKLDGVHPLHRK